MTTRVLLTGTTLEALKKEAKRLLKSSKEGQPDALDRVKPYFDDTEPYKLTQMQLVLAREYGFSSWAKLRSHLVDEENLAVAQREVLKIQLRMNGRKSMPDWRISQLETTLFARQLAAMFKIGVPLMESLKIIADDTENPVMSDLILNVRNEIMSTGMQMHAVLRKHPEHFSDLFCRFVEAGEKVGALDKTFDIIADYQESVQKQQSAIAR